MKTLKKLSAILFIIAVFMSIQNEVFAQAYAYGTAVPLPVLHDELQSTHGIMAIMTGNATGGGTALTYLGITLNTLPTSLAMPPEME